ncbi:glucose-1-phosphate thymidylyltransferase [Shewanella sp. OPT22]|nr:glucose-1-phosphate thymidylyltransferase [Shewanella sp. OPT22]
MKGIVLAGGTGSRLHPITLGISKQLLPVYNKPMIYYPISTLMLAGIRDILIITTADEQANFQRLLGDGSQFGVNFTYLVQPKPEGIAQAFILAEAFINGESVSLILGDNIFYGQSFSRMLKHAAKSDNATLFIHQVKQPQRFGVVEFDSEGNVIAIVEKPEKPKSDFAVTGLYFYDNRVVDFAKQLTPSARGELEITDINQMYLEQDALKVELLGRGFAWLDTGTPESLHEASSFVQTIEHVQGLKVACLEEIAWRNGWISEQHLFQLAESMQHNEYGQYLKQLVTHG